MSMKSCPDCGGDLGRSAMKCRCGWTSAAAQKANLPPNHIQCAADSACRKPGRMSPVAEGLFGYQAKDRICVEHYYFFLERIRRSA